MSRARRLFRKAMLRFIPEPILRPLARVVGWTSYAPTHGRVRFGSLHRTTPLSRHWGWDRGLPVDRHYIEAFLARHAADIRGRVLEPGDASYTVRFGADRVTRSDVLHPHAGNPDATVTGDLNTGAGLPTDTFDCIILPETLQFVFHVSTAMRVLHDMLRPGGVLLLTVPGITHTGDETWREHWYWMFTARSLERLAAEHFAAGSFRIESHGNVLAATAFLYGMAASELTPAEIDAVDRDYPVTLTLRAVKGGDRPAAGSGAVAD